MEKLQHTTVSCECRARVRRYLQTLPGPFWIKRKRVEEWKTPGSCDRYGLMTIGTIKLVCASCFGPACSKRPMDCEYVVKQNTKLAVVAKLSVPGWQPAASCLCALPYE